MSTYTEKQVRDLISSNLKLQEDNLRLEKLCEEYKSRAESAEQKYFSLAERCIQLYVNKDVTEEVIQVKVYVPNFMSQEDLTTAMIQTLTNNVVKERDRLKLIQKGLSYAEV